MSHSLDDREAFIVYLRILSLEFDQEDDRLDIYDGSTLDEEAPLLLASFTGSTRTSPSAVESSGSAIYVEIRANPSPLDPLDSPERNKRFIAEYFTISIVRILLLL